MESSDPTQGNARDFVGGARTYLVLLVLHELVDEVRADEAGPTCDQDPQVRLDQSAR
jgi:hypothetical protein